MEKLLREFTLDNEKFTVACTETDLNVMSSRGVLNYPVTKHTDMQKQRIFESHVPEFMAGRDFGEASRLIIAIEAGAIL